MSPAPVPAALSKNDQTLCKESRVLRDDLRTAANLASEAARLSDLAESVGTLSDKERDVIRTHLAKAHRRMVNATTKITTTLIDTAT